MRWTRYADIDFPSRSPLTTIVTRAPALPRWTTAWPAELPAPTTKTSSPPHLRGLAAAGPVVDAAAEQFLHALDLESPPVHAGGGEHDVGGDLLPAGDPDNRRPAGLQLPAGDPVENQQLSSEALGLPAGPPCKLRAADAVRKAEEVLDQRGVGGLAAGHLALEYNRREAVGGRVHSGPETGRPRPDDCQLVVGPRRTREDPPGFGEPLHRRPGVDSVAVDDDRQHGSLRARLCKQCLGFGRAGFVELVRLRPARQEVAQPVMIGIKPSPDQVDDGTGRAHSCCEGTEAVSQAASA